MYEIPQEVLSALREDAPQSVKIKLSPVKGEEIILTRADIGNNLEIECASLTGDKLMLGAALMSKLKMSINNYESKFNRILLEGAELFVTVGISIGIGREFPIPMGYYKITSVARTLQKIDVEAYDRMSKFDRPYVSSLSYPACVYQIVLDCCKSCAVPCAVTAQMLNANVQIQAKPEENNLTFRQVLIWCAQIMGLCFYIDRDGRLNGKWYPKEVSNIHPEILSSDRFRGNTDFAERDIKTTGINIEIKDKQSAVSGNLDYAFNISGNALISNIEQAKSISKSLYKNRMVTYRPMKCSTHSFPHIEPLDRFRFVKQGRNLIDIPEHTLSGFKDFYPEKELPAGTYSITYEADSTFAGDKILIYVSDAAGEETNELLFLKGELTSLTFKRNKPIKFINLYAGMNWATSQGQKLHIKKVMLERNEPSLDFEPYSTIVFDTLITNTRFKLGGSSSLESKGKTAQMEKSSFSSAFTAKQKAIIEQVKKETHEDVESSAELLAEINETVSNAMGYYVTQKKDEHGGVITYQHDRPKLEDSKTIYCRSAGGFMWTNDGWNNSNPKWSRGVDKNGNCILNAIAVNKLYADYIEAGILSSKTGKFSINLDTGRCNFLDVKATGEYITLGKNYDLKISNHTFYPGEDFEYDSIGLYKYNKSGVLDSSICFEDNNIDKEPRIILKTPTVSADMHNGGLRLKENSDSKRTHEVYLSATNEPSNFARGIKTGFGGDYVSQALNHMYGYWDSRNNEYINDSLFTISRKDNGSKAPGMSFKVNHVIYEQMGGLLAGQEVSAEMELYTTDTNYMDPGDSSNAHSVSMRLYSCGELMGTLTFSKNGHLYYNGKRII